MKKSLLAILLVMCVVLSVFAGCTSSTATVSPTATTAQTKAATIASAAAAAPTTGATTAQTSKPATVTTTAASTGGSQETVTFTDDPGRTVTVPKNITRIAPSGSMAQIVIFALAPEKLVGVSNAWGAEAKPYIAQKYLDLPVMGQLYTGTSSTLSMEELAKIGPQIIIDVGDPKPTVKEDLDKIQKQLGIPAVHIDASTETMPSNYLKMGKLLCKEKEAEALAQYLEKTYATTNDIVKQVGDAKKTKVLYCLGDKGINVLAKGSIHSGVIDMVGNNVALIEKPVSSGAGNEADMERIINWNPDVIFFAPQSVYSKAGSDSTWQQLPAIKNKKYYEVPLGPYNWMGSPPSVNQYLGMIWSTKLLYPDLAKYDVYQEVSKYYELFYGGTKLTQDQYKALVANSLGKQ
jgi:iron complex transport system substrate-binding protein